MKKDENVREGMRRGGFTLMEVMIVIAICAILATVAVPALMSMRSGSQFRSASQDVFLGLLQAKAAAIRNNVDCAVTFKQPVDGKSYDLVVYLDNDATREYTAGDTVVETIDLSSYGKIELDTTKAGGDGIDDAFTANDDGRPTLYFSPAGLPMAIGGAPVTGIVYFKDDGGREGQVRINTTGFIEIL